LKLYRAILLAILYALPVHAADSPTAGIPAVSVTDKNGNRVHPGDAANRAIRMIEVTTAAAAGNAGATAGIPPVKFTDEDGVSVFPGDADLDAIRITCVSGCGDSLTADSVDATHIDETDDYTFSGKVFAITTVGSLAASPSAGTFAIITDGDTAADCVTGSGAFRVLCEFDGSDWAAVSGGVTDHGNLAGLSDDDHSAIYVKFESSAGVPAAGSCERAGQIQFDTTNSRVYACYNADDPVDIGDQGDSYVQVCGDSGCATASGADTLTIATGAGLNSTGSTDTVTIAIDNHVKSIYLPANALTTDGTQCANPALATINSGPRIYTIICTDNDASTVFAHLVMPDSWNGGTFTVELEYLQTAADTSAMNSDVAGQCRGAGETVNNTWGTEIAIDDAAVSGSNIVDHATSAAITADGTCAAGDTLFIRWQLDATGTTTAVATLHILGMKVEYTVTGAGSD
jgi:hypothetical protein